MKCLLFHVGTEETTAAPSEETTAAPPGKSSSNKEQEKTGSIQCYFFLEISKQIKTKMLIRFTLVLFCPMNLQRKPRRHQVKKLQLPHQVTSSTSDNNSSADVRQKITINWRSRLICA